MTATELQVHPAAAVFPMLADDELAELAEDIRANGLHHPIVLDDDGVLIDGRNRLAACRLAGVEPTFTHLDGQDPVAFILSENIHRRHLTEGQRAIATVRAIGSSKLEATRGAKGEAARVGGTQPSRIAEALIIIEHAPELADEVMRQSKPFSVAHQEAQALRDAQDRRERAAAAEATKLARLKADDPSLHLLVLEERLSLDEAMTTLAERRQREADARRATTGLLVQTLDFLDPRAMTPSELAETIARRIDGRQWPTTPDLSPERLMRCASTLALVIDLLGEERPRGD